MPSITGVEVEVYAPGDEDDKRNHEELHEIVDESDYAEDPLATTTDGYLERLTTRDGKLVIGIWTGSENADGWYVDVKIPLLPTDRIQSFLNDLSGTLSNFSERFAVEQVESKTVGEDGRVSIGTKYSGKTKRVAVLKDD